MMDLKAELQKKGLEYKADKRASLTETVNKNKRISNEFSRKPKRMQSVKESLKPLNSSDDIFEKSRLKLEEKSRLYDRIRYGDTDGITHIQIAL
jgi:predicted nuclease with TOPRIM domain